MNRCTCAVGQVCSPSVVQAGVIRLIAVPHEYSPVGLSSELHGGEQRQPWRGEQELATPHLKRLLGVTLFKEEKS